MKIFDPGSILTNVRVLIGPTAFLGALVILSVIALRVGVSRVVFLRTQVAESKNEERHLTEKLEVLKSSEASALPLADLSLIAVPSDNPALTIISQVKALASQKGIAITSFEAKQASSVEEDISKTEIELVLAGEMRSLLDFLQALKTISPLVTLDQTTLRQESGAARVDVLLLGNFASLPQTIPSLSSPFNELTAEEKDILAKISSYSQPQFTEVLPSGPYERTDLFNF